MKLIDKDKIIAEIEKRIKSLHQVNSPREQAVLYECKDLISFLNNLEEKEVDLEKECDTWRHNHFHGKRDKEASGEYLERSSQLDLAKHFFELGVKTHKGE